MTIFYSNIESNGNKAFSTISVETANSKVINMTADDCTDCSNCSNCSNCIYCINCINCIECSNCSNCTKCINCNNCQIQPMQLIGLHWTVTFHQGPIDYSIKIGCQKHSRKFWETCSMETIREMDSHAEEFWIKYKQLILSIPYNPITPVQIASI